METPVYTMQGHGCDLKRTERIPEGCMYVTIALCGLPSYNDSSYNKMLELFSSNDPMLYDPKKNFKKIEEAIGQKIHVHFYGTNDGDSNTYQDCIYDPFSKWHCDKDGKHISEQNSSELTHFFAYKSGLFEPGNPLIIPQQIFNKQTIPIEQINTIWEHSLLPTTKIILEQIKDVPSITYDALNLAYHRALHTEFGFESITQKELFRRRPGIYYNMACRVPCYADEKPYLDLRRENSDKAQTSFRTSFEEEDVVSTSRDTFLDYIKNTRYLNPKIFKILNAHPEYSEFRDSKNNTPLMIVLNQPLYDIDGRLHLVNQLLDKGADVNSVNKKSVLTLFILFTFSLYPMNTSYIENIVSKANPNTIKQTIIDIFANSMVNNDLDQGVVFETLKILYDASKKYDFFNIIIHSIEQHKTKKFLKMYKEFFKFIGEAPNPMSDMHAGRKTKRKLRLSKTKKTRKMRKSKNPCKSKKLKFKK